MSNIYDSSLRLSNELINDSIESINCTSQTESGYCGHHSSSDSLDNIYIQGTGGIKGTEFVIDDSVDVVYVNPIHGTINIILQASNHQIITFKDVTPEFGVGSHYNVNIAVRGSSVRIEHHSNGIKADTNAYYILNTSGGSVTFRFAKFPIPGSIPTWVIQNEFRGNQRIGRAKFQSADDHMREKVINLK